MPGDREASFLEDFHVRCSPCFVVGIPDVLEWDFGIREEQPGPEQSSVSNAKHDMDVLHRGGEEVAHSISPDDLPAPEAAEIKVMKGRLGVCRRSHIESRFAQLFRQRICES
jgi:hypothetical protein